MSFLIETLRLGLTNLRLHKLRSLLTALGIIFGVAAVITMVAIGEGNKLKALAAIEQLGARNIIVSSVKPTETGRANESRSFLLDYGIRRIDLRRIQASVKPVDRIVPLKRVGSEVSDGRNRVPAEVYGTTPELIETARLRIARGRYLKPSDLEKYDNVAVLGASVAERLFPLRDPLGNVLQVSTRENIQIFKVIGILKPVGLAGGAGSALVGHDLNFDVHIPITTAVELFGDQNFRRSSGSFQGEKMELSHLYIEVSDEQHVLNVSEQVKRILEMEHAKSGDVTTIVPLELLEQKKKTMLLFNVLMVFIAAISLIVGGIGIMNIMLASVTERTREIGILRALGAMRSHIVAQFLVETTILSGVGGLMGVAFGWSIAEGLGLLHTMIAGLEKPEVTGGSVIAGFTVATAVGIVFGLYPAIRAAQQDPIVALRHD